MILRGHDALLRASYGSREDIMLWEKTPRSWKFDSLGRDSPILERSRCCMKRLSGPRTNLMLWEAPPWT